MEEITATEAARRLHISDKTVRKWIHQGKLAAREVTINGLRQYAISASDVEALAQSEEASGDESAARIAALELRVRELELHQAQLLERIERAASQHARAVKPKVVRPSAGDEEPIELFPQPIEELAPGLVSAKEFAIAHGINPGTAKSAYQTGRIPTIRGKWRGPGRNPIEVALDATGRQIFHQVYRDRLTPAEGCEICAAEPAPEK